MFASFFHNVVSFVRSQEIRMARMAQLHGVGMPAIHGPGVRLAVATCKAEIDIDPTTGIGAPATFRHRMQCGVTPSSPLWLIVFWTGWRCFVYWGFGVVLMLFSCCKTGVTIAGALAIIWRSEQADGRLQSFSEFAREKPFEWILKYTERHCHWCSISVRHPGRRHNFFRWNPFESADLWFSMVCRSRMVQEDAKAQVLQPTLLSPWSGHTYNYVPFARNLSLAVMAISNCGRLWELIRALIQTGSNTANGKHHNSLLRIANSPAVSIVTLWSSWQSINSR